MREIDAIYQNGVFKPLGAVEFAEDQKVRLHIRPLEGGDVQSWFEEVQQHQRQIVQRRGFFPDSTSDIAADRAR